MCIGPSTSYVTPTMARVGDQVIVTKGAAIEAAGLFAVTFPQRVERAYGSAFARSAQEIFYQMSVVDDALTAVSAGIREEGVTSMHDATECGVWGGLFEIAEASGVGMVIDKEKIICQDAVRKVCELFGIDPYVSISEGTLIITCRPHRAGDVLKRLGDKGIPASAVGEVVDRKRGMRYFESGRSHRLVHPRVDPFWAAFGRAASEGGGNAS